MSVRHRDTQNNHHLCLKSDSLGQSLAFSLTGHPLTLNDQTHGQVTPPPTTMVSLVAQMVQPLPTMQETWVRSLGQEDALEKRMATHSSMLAWEIPWAEEPGGLQSMECQRVGHIIEQLTLSHLSVVVVVVFNCIL